MSPEDLIFLKSCEGRILAVELLSGEQFFAEIVMVVDEPPTPDVFLLRVLREPDGAFIAPAQSPAQPGYQSGESILLAGIRRVAAIPGVDYTL